MIEYFELNFWSKKTIVCHTHWGLQLGIYTCHTLLLYIHGSFLPHAFTRFHGSRRECEGHLNFESTDSRPQYHHKNVHDIEKFISFSLWDNEGNMQNLGTFQRVSIIRYCPKTSKVRIVSIEILLIILFGCMILVILYLCRRWLVNWFEFSTHRLSTSLAAYMFIVLRDIANGRLLCGCMTTSWLWWMIT